MRLRETTNVHFAELADTIADEIGDDTKAKAVAHRLMEAGLIREGGDIETLWANAVNWRTDLAQALADIVDDCPSGDPKQAFRAIERGRQLLERYLAGASLPVQTLTRDELRERYPQGGDR